MMKKPQEEYTKADLEINWIPVNNITEGLHIDDDVTIKVKDKQWETQQQRKTLNKG